MIGVVSESDLLAKLALGIERTGLPGMITGILRHQQLEKARAITARRPDDLPAVTVSPEDTVEQAARIMYLRNVKRLPVVDADGHLAGIVSRADVLAVTAARRRHPRGIMTDVAVDRDSPTPARSTSREGRHRHADRQPRSQRAVHRSSAEPGMSRASSPSATG